MGTDHISPSEAEYRVITEALVSDAADILSDEHLEKPYTIAEITIAKQAFRSIWQHIDQIALILPMGHDAHRMAIMCLHMSRRLSRVPELPETQLTD